ncbi:MAG: ATP-binding cassette domain-containing protein, partial [Candidatus Eisenbacteria bacterium]|nr:ATP-binding cassette domain-containing protein [Candidatus Eisenbacteria bacterium]
MLAPAVRLERITRRCGSVLANDEVTLELAPGEIHALVGENGAGKTTLMRVLYGLMLPDSGSITIDGQPQRFRSPLDAMRHGLGMVHQHFMLVDTQRVYENVTLALEPRRSLDRFDVEAARRRVRELSERYGLPADPDARVRDLSVGAQQRIEILKALHHGARVLILDEPTAVLTPQEVDDLFAALRNLQREGTTIVLITHKLAEVKALADRVTVMRAGRVVGGGEVADFTIERMAELMVGQPVNASYERPTARSEVPLLEARLLDVMDDRGLAAVRGASFIVHGGEIVGLVGVDGNGQHELVECLAGLRVPSHGEVWIGGRRIAAADPRAHTAAGLAHIPSDRLRRGIVPSMTLAENLVLGCQHDPELGSGPRLDPELVEARADRLLAEY